MTTLSCRVKVDLVIGGRVYASNGEPKSSGSGSTVDKFFVSAWVGGKSPELSLCELASDHTANVVLPLSRDDVNTVKFCVSYNVKTPNGTRHYHLASDFLHINDLASALEDDSNGLFQNCRRNFIMADNCNNHAAVLLFSNTGTDISALRNVCTAQSALLHMDEMNTAICALGNTLQQKLSTCTVSSNNAGTQFVNAFSYGHMKGCLTHYAILGDCFHNMSSGVNLPLLMYFGYQTSIATGLTLKCIEGMSDDDLVSHFGVRMVTIHTACDLTAPYSSDLTMNAVGVVCKDTEDIAKTMCALLMRTQGVDTHYSGLPEHLGSQTWAQTLDAIQKFSAPESDRQRLSATLVHDDCENLSCIIDMHAKGLEQIYTTYSAKPEPALLQDMLQIGASSPLFSNITETDHKQMAGILMRLGGLQHSGKWKVSLGVVSAKGPSFKENSSGENLSGHGCGISRHLSAQNTWKYQPLEGTSYLVIDQPMAQGMASHVDLVFQDGSTESESISNLATIIGQNIHSLIGISCNSRIAAHIASDNKNPPFYMDVFYCGLIQRANDLGSVNLNHDDTNGKLKFGIPVLSLSDMNSMSLPVERSLLETTERNGGFIAKQIALVANEAWGPAACEADITRLMSYWQPCSTLNSPLSIDNTDQIHQNIVSECSWAFDNPVDTATAVNFYKGIANRFNAIQEKDTDNDGIRMSVHGKFLSASLLLHIPIPKQNTKFKLSTMANLRKCVIDLGIATAVAAPHVKQRIQNRQNVQTDSHFYMCDRGAGLVHAHIRKLA